MAFERTDYDEFLVGHKNQAGPATGRDTLRMIQQAGVRAELLTGHEGWDTFLTYVQAALESNRAAASRYQQELSNPLIVNADRVAQLRFALIRLNARTEALSWVIAMPVQITAMGARAAEQIKQLPEIDAGEAA